MRDRRASAAAPELGLGGGRSVGACRLSPVARFEDSDYARRTRPPMLVVGSGGDRVVDKRAIERFAQRVRSARLIVIDGAEHEIMLERDALRNQFWAAFDKFIPGVEGAPPPRPDCRHSSRRSRPSPATRSVGARRGRASRSR